MEIRKKMNQLFLFSNMLGIASGILVVLCKENTTHDWGTHVSLILLLAGVIIPLFSFDHLLLSGEESDLNKRTEKIVMGMVLNIVIFTIIWRLAFLLSTIC